MSGSSGSGTGPGMRIRLLKKGRVARSYKVKPDTFTIGSGKEATIRAAGVPGLAPKHALVWLDDGIPTLVPSAGCTVQVNGKEVQFARLDPADIITIGKLELQIQAGDQPNVSASATPSSMTPPPAVPDRSPPPPGFSSVDEDAPTRVGTVPIDPATGKILGLDAIATGLPADPPTSVSPIPNFDDMDVTAAAKPPPAPPGLSPPPAFHGAEDPFPPLKPPPAEPEQYPPHDDLEEPTTVSRPVVAVAPATPEAEPVAPAAPQPPPPQPDIEHKPTTMGIPLPRIPREEEPKTIEVDHKPTTMGQPLPLSEVDHAAPPAPPSAPSVPEQPSVVVEQPLVQVEPPSPPSPSVSAPLEPLPPLDYGPWDDDDEEEDDEFTFVEPFSLVDHIEQAGAPERSGPRENYVTAQVIRQSEGRMWGVVSLAPGQDYRKTPKAQPMVRMGKDGRCTVSLTSETTGSVWVGGQQTPVSTFVGDSPAGKARLSDGDYAVLDSPEGKYVVRVMRPARTPKPSTATAARESAVLTAYAVGVLGILVGLVFSLGMFIERRVGGSSGSGVQEEQYELISQNDLTLIAPQNVDRPEEEAVEEEIEEDDSDVQPEEIPPEAVPRTTRRASRTRASSGGSAASQLISALSSSGGGGGNLQDVITNIDAIGSSSAGSALFKMTGTITSGLGGDVKLARRGGGGGVQTKGGGALGAASPGLGAVASKGRSGKVRGRVSRVSTQMRVTGRLDRGEILRVINRSIGRITRCYESRLVSNPGLSGRIVFGWRINEQGRVSGASVRSSTLSDPQVASCIARVIRGMRFPQPEGGPVSVSFPFVFRAVDF